MATALTVDMARLKEGDEEALAELARYLRFVTAGMLQHYPETNVGDVVQDVLVEVMKNRERLAEFESTEQLAAYCRRLARNTVVHRARRTRQEVGVPDPEAEDLQADAPEHEDPGSDAVALLRLEEVIGGLPDRDRTILELLYFEGKTRSEVARDLGLAVGTVSQLHRSALRKVRKGLDARQTGGEAG